MSDTLHTITINGKIYNASTGKPVVSTPVTKKTATSHATTVDGVIRPTTVFQPKAAATPVKKLAHAHAVVAAQKLHASPERTHTLKRAGLQKPGKTRTKAANQTIALAQSANDQIHHLKHDQARAERARLIAKSQSISKYGTPRLSSVVRKSRPMPLAEAPVHAHAPEAAPPVHKLTSHTVPTKDTMIQNALHNATSHNQALHAIHRKHKKRRLTTAGVAAFVLLLGFIAYQNTTYLSVQFAAQNAGFHASLPGYKPTGFDVKGPVQHHGGQINLTYRSNTDDRAYTLSQSASNWDSSTLASTLSQKGTAYQTVDAKGQTVYIYNQSSATWVNKGIWYQIEGDSKLSSDQLLKIVGSL